MDLALPSQQVIEGQALLGAPSWPERTCISLVIRLVRALGQDPSEAEGRWGKMTEARAMATALRAYPEFAPDVYGDELVKLGWVSLPPSLMLMPCDVVGMLPPVAFGDGYCAPENPASGWVGIVGPDHGVYGYSTYGIQRTMTGVEAIRRIWRLS